MEKKVVTKESVMEEVAHDYDDFNEEDIDGVDRLRVNNPDKILQTIVNMARVSTANTIEEDSTDD